VETSFFWFWQVTSSSPVDFFEPCATAEWEVLMDENSQLTTKLKMPEEI